MEYYMIKNWDKFQHYKKEGGNPAWIKLYISTLSDMTFRRLRDQTKLLWFHLMLLSGTNQNKLDLSPVTLRKCCGIRIRTDNIQELIDSGMLVQHESRPTLDAGYAREEKRRKERREKRREEKKPQTPSIGFDSFWTAYPRKTGKGAAKKAWNKIRPDEALREEIINAIDRQKRSTQWMKDSGQFIPNPATWLNQERWADSIETEVFDDGIPQGDQRSMAALRKVLQEEGEG
jgi:hypothetical protein